MHFTFTAVAKLQLEQISKGIEGEVKGLVESKCCDIMMIPSDNLNVNGYINPVTHEPTKEGSEAMTICFIQGLIANIHASEHFGYRKSPEHLRFIIDELEKGLVAITEIEIRDFKGKY
jgi:hypothetical protein